MLLRPAHPEDALAVAHVHVQSWQVGYRGLIADGYLDAMRPEERAARYTFGSSDPEVPYTIVAEDAGAIRGFVTTRPGELMALYVHPEAWGHGFGRALIAAGRTRLASLRSGTATLWLLEGNTRAERFYRADGWQPDGTQQVAKIWGLDLPERRFARELP